MNSDLIAINRIYSALLISLYSTFESRLTDLCILFHQTGLPDVSINNFKWDDYIDKVLTYLSITGYISFSRKDTVWKAMQTFQSIRNSITHNQMNIIQSPEKPIQEQKLFKIISENQSFKLDRNTWAFQIIDSWYMLDMAGKCMEIIKRMTHDIEQKRVIIKNRRLPYDLTNWGIEKTTRLLESVVYLVEIWESITLWDNDSKESISSTAHNMAWELTKLLSLFYDGHWETSDPDVVIWHWLKWIKLLEDQYKSWLGKDFI